MFTAKQEFNDKIISSLNKLGICTPQSRAHQLYTLNHKQAFLAVELEIGVVPNINSILHDIDKVVTYGRIPKKEASDIHRKYSTHHYFNCKTHDDYIQCIIDYECGRFTKRDKRASAYDYIINRSDLDYELLKPTLQELGLDGGTKNDNRFFTWNHCDKRIVRRWIEQNIEAIAAINKASDIYGEEEAVRMFYAGKLNIW